MAPYVAPDVAPDMAPDMAHARSIVQLHRLAGMGTFTLAGAAGRVGSCNSSAAGAVGRHEEDLVGEPVSRFIHGADRAAFMVSIFRRLETTGLQSW